MTLDSTANSDFYRLSADDGPVWWLRGDPRCEPAWRPIGLSPSVRVPISSSGDQALEERTFSPSAIGPQAHVHRLFVWLMRVSTSLRYELAQAVPAHCLVAKLPRRRDLRRGRIPALTQPERFSFVFLGQAMHRLDGSQRYRSAVWRLTTTPAEARARASPTECTDLLVSRSWRT